LTTRLTHRVQRIRPSATVAVTALAARLRDEGQDIIALSAGEPDFDTPDHIKEAACAAIRSGQTKYTSVDGTRTLKEAIIGKFRRDNGLEFVPEQVLVSSGAKQACYGAAQALLETGDEAIIPAPYWVSYPDMVRLADAQAVIVRTSAATGFRMTPELLESAIGPQTRALILNSPCNPTGTAYARGDWQALGDVLAEHPQVFIITDEIYEHIYWGREPFCSLLSACPELAERTLTVNGVSKCYAMTGWRLGYAAGPEAVIRAMTAIQSQSTTNACTISQIAAEAALTGDQACVRRMCAAFEERHAYVLERLNGLAGVECPPAEGAFYAFPDVTAAIERLGLRDDVAFCERLLQQQGLAIVPGSAFGAPGHVRLSFAAAQATLESGLDRLSKFIR
jgi:aspartate aminotransferase